MMERGVLRESVLCACVVYVQGRECLGLCRSGCCQAVFVGGSL